MGKPTYWLDLFTGTTWKEFLDAGAKLSGFRERRWKTLQSIKQKDLFLCYLTGLSRFIGLLEGGRSIPEVARDLDLTESALRMWVRQAEVDQGRGKPGALTTAERGRTAIHDDIGPFYNPHRRHSSLGYLSPMDYERQHAATVAA